MNTITITVQSETTDGVEYRVVGQPGQGWRCDCPDYIYRSHNLPYVCKHIASVTLELVEFTETTRARSTRAADIIG